MNKIQNFLHTAKNLVKKPALLALTSSLFLTEQSNGQSAVKDFHGKDFLSPKIKLSAGMGYSYSAQAYKKGPYVSMDATIQFPNEARFFKLQVKYDRYQTQTAGLTDPSSSTAPLAMPKSGLGVLINAGSPPNHRFRLNGYFGPEFNATYKSITANLNSGLRVEVDLLRKNAPFQATIDAGCDGVDFSHAFIEKYNSEWNYNNSYHAGLKMAYLF